LISKSDYYFLFVFIPILIGICGLIKSLISKNIKLYLFLLPSILFLIFEVLLGAIGVQTIMTKYTSIIYPVIICSACYGLSLIKIRPLSVIIFAVLVVLNCSYFCIVKNNVFAIHRKGLSQLTEVMDTFVQPDDEDYILIPYSGSKVMKYVPHGKFIQFNADDALLLKDSASRTFYFDRKFYKSLNRNNIKETLKYDIVEDVPFILYEVRLLDYYFDKMKKGQKFILISYRNSFTMPLIQNWDVLKESANYENINMFAFLMSKITRDSIQLCEKYLKPVNTYTDEQGDYTIFVYEKQ
ncbi:hypothetical protein IJ707_03080, partial [bacterium]|nr:hypothetical protein [bacterium]